MAHASVVPAILVSPVFVGCIATIGMSTTRSNDPIEQDFATEFELLTLELKRANDKRAFDTTFKKIEELVDNKRKLEEYGKKVFEASKKRWAFEKKYRYQPPDLEYGMCASH